MANLSEIVSLVISCQCEIVNLMMNCQCELCEIVSLVV